MANRVVIWTKTAIKQRRGILKYWTTRNKSSTYAIKLIRLINKLINRILKHPESFKLTEFPDTGKSALGHFSIFYKITDKELIITAFCDNRQDPKKLLELTKK
jgi:plasmid stabilization system protein ParE